MALSRVQKVRLLGDLYKYLGGKIKRRPRYLIGAKDTKKDIEMRDRFTRRMAKKYNTTQAEINRFIKDFPKDF